MADAGLTDHGLNTLWDHFDELVDAITDPDALAEETCIVGLIHPESKGILKSLSVDAKTKTRSLLQSVEGKIKDQPVCFNLFLAVLKKLPGLANLGATLQRTYDDKLASRMVDASASYHDDAGSTDHFVTESNSCVSQDECSHAISPQQEDNGRSGGSGDSAVLDEKPRLHQLQCLCRDNVVVNVIRAVAPSWEKFALCLTMERNMIDIWKRSAGPDELEDAARKLFGHWLDGNGRQPISWRTLIQALCENNLPIIASEVEEILTGHSVIHAKHPLKRSAEEEAAEKRPCLEGRHNETNDVDFHSANVAIYICVDHNPVDNVLEKHPLEKLAQEVAEKRPRLEGEHNETRDVDSHSANVTIANNPVVREKHPLEKLAEITAKKDPRLEGERSETSNIDSHSANVAVDSNLLKHRPKLAAYYSHQPEIPQDAWPPVNKTQFIHLALIRIERPIDHTKEFLRQTIRDSIDDIMKDKDDIKYNKVFTEVEEGAMLLFEGRPGCGKTTMMNKVSQDWAKWKIFSSCLLFLVHLRRLGNRSDIDLETVLCSTPVDFSEEEFQQIQTHIEDSQGEGVVFALDGLDEYCPDKKEMKTTFVHKLIKGQILPKSVVIVASRPAASQKYRRDSTKCIEVLGFLKEQIYEYIDSYFKNKHSLVVGLRTYLEHHPNVMHMCYLPLHMAMITYLYEVEGASLPQTETEIYRHFTLYTLLRSIRRRNDTEMEIDDDYHLLMICSEKTETYLIVFLNLLMKPL